ncbi:GvpL/GvpF family gas vesicle protein [Streptomyces sp. 7N604]|uniref:GvpL/GvpF family gas vesicle protein n=1 Tax=Streptomyces sp. 7N604 TaxID=3457415 RepID=UPI003FD0F371
MTDATELAEPAELQYAYAVIRAEDCPLPEGLRGVGGTPVLAVRASGFAAVVSPVSAAEFDEVPLRTHLEDMRWLEETARSHQRVVDAVARAGCALPLRLATVYRGEESLRGMLASGRERFEATFALLDGRDEWGVKIYADIDPATGTAAADPGAGAAASTGGRVRPASGRDYLRQRQRHRRAQEEAWQEAEDRAREAHQALGRFAEHTRLHRPQDARLSGATGRNILNGTYLVRREEADAFAALVGEQAGRAVGLRIELTGPWAPYSFTGLAGGSGGGNRAETAETESAR